jgi:hypothetical protein
MFAKYSWQNKTRRSRISFRFRCFFSLFPTFLQTRKLFDASHFLLLLDGFTQPIYDTPVQNQALVEEMRSLFNGLTYIDKPGIIGKLGLICISSGGNLHM